MPISALITNRFAELDQQINSLRLNPKDLGGLLRYPPGEWQQWATSAHHLLESVFGTNSPHARNFERIYSKTTLGTDYEVHAMRGIFRAAKADYEGGLAFSLQTQISGEIYGDFVGLAKRALSEGSKDVAAVLACAALEDVLKRLAVLNGLDVSDKGMQEVVNALKGAGLVTGAQKSLLDTMPKIRDYAMHANWVKIEPQDVGSVIGFVEQLLLTKFS